MLHASTQQLIRKLCELTDAGAINWKEGKGQISVLETEGYVVEIDADPPSVRLLRGDGQELERADAADLQTPWGENDGTFADRVADMARRANRFARGAETAIAKILSSLSAPPKKQVEPEPEPAALAFAAVEKPAHTVKASESAAAIAAVNADLDSQRRKAAEDPPVSHSVADAPAPVIAPETETAIDRVLAVQPPVIVAPEPPKEEPKPEPPKPVAAAPAPAPTAVAAPRPAPTLPPPIQPAPPPVTSAPVRAAPVVQAASAPIPAPPKPAEPAPAPASPAAVAKAGFGAIDGFARAQPAPAKPAAPTPQPSPQPERKVEPASSGLLMRGFSAQSKQTVEPATIKDFYRAPGAPPAPTAQPPQPSPIKPEPKPEPVKSTGKDVYKPWG